MGQKIGWKPIEAYPEINIVNVIPGWGIAYATATLESDADRDVELVMAFRGGAKVWLNGKLIKTIVPGRRAYYLHRMSTFAHLKKGKNLLLVKQGVVICVNAVGQIVAFQIEPYQLHRVEFRGVGWKRNQGDVIRHPKLFTRMPAGAIQHQGYLHIRVHRLADLGQMEVHAERVGGWHQVPDRLTTARAGRPEQVHPLVFRLPPTSGSRPPLRPDVRQRTLLAEPAFVLEPDFDPSVRMRFLDLL